MYIPQAFAVTDLLQLQEWMEQFSFATLVSAGAGLQGSHLPLSLRRAEGPHGTLLGHFARASDHWKGADGQPALAIFHGPHAYISPRWYEDPNLVPTWNYVAVHAYGRLEVVDDPDWGLGLVRQMTEDYEASFDAPWRLSADTASLQALAKQIVPFRIPIQRLEGKAKLSQNHPAARRERVAAGLRERGSENDRQIAELMLRH